jgi:ADP-ribose pyrophosphatase YjhB (NUDIX family)
MGNEQSAHNEKPSVGGVVNVVYTDTHIVLVREAWRNNPKRKCSGGGIDEGEEPARAGRRECKQETGIYLRLDQFYEPFPPPGPYGKHYFFIKADERQIRSHVEIGEDGGVVSLARRDEIGQIPDLLPEHELLMRLISLVESMRAK